MVSAAVNQNVKGQNIEDKQRKKERALREGVRKEEEKGGARKEEEKGIGLAEGGGKEGRRNGEDKG